MKNARFWEWINDGWVKLTLHPGGKLEHVTGGPHDEGYSRNSTTWAYEPEEDGLGGTVGIVYCHTLTEGRDCDGPHQWYCKSMCFVNTLKSRDMHQEEQDRAECWSADPKLPEFHRNVGIYAPTWQRIEASQRDAFAEAMGY